MLDGEGVVPGGTDTETPFDIDVATGEVEESRYTVVPFGDYADHGLFWDDSTGTMVAYPHAK